MLLLRRTRHRETRPADLSVQATRFRPRLEGLEGRWLPSVIIDIGPGTAHGLNNLGQVVGETLASGGVNHAFVWDADTGLQDLGTLQGTGFSSANGINDAGQVVGSSATDQFFQSHAFVWDADHGLQDLGTLGGTSSGANAINSAGTIAGSADLPGGDRHAALWDADGIHDIGSLGGVFASANAINDAGQVVGNSTIPTGLVAHAFLWDSKNGMQDLGTLGGPYSIASGLNTAGQVVGESTPADSSSPHGFLWDADGGMQDLGALPGSDFSRAYGINDLGLIVGSSFTAAGPRAVLWCGSGILDLNDLLPPGSGWTLQSANAVNDAGQIVGGGFLDGNPHAFLLTLDGAPHGGRHPAGRAGAPPREVAGALAETAAQRPVAPPVSGLQVAPVPNRPAVEVVAPGTVTASPGGESLPLFAGWHHRNTAGQTADGLPALASENPVSLIY